MNNCLTSLLLLLGFCAPLLGQTEVNGYDGQGMRHGLWQKHYDQSTQLRYQGHFEHGKEVGAFKFYCSDCGDQPTAIREFNAQETGAVVSYYTKKGHLVSTGRLIDQKRDGIWETYHKDSKVPMSRESYQLGALNGTKETFYPNGKLAESLTYNNDVIQGTQLFYGHNGQLIKSYHYEDGQLHGPAFFYDAQGQMTAEGQYKRDKKHGLWRYYDQGVLTKEETFPKQ